MSIRIQIYNCFCGTCGFAVELKETMNYSRWTEIVFCFYEKDSHYTYPNGDEVYVVDIVYIYRNYHGKLKKQKAEVEQLAFFSIDNLPAPISPPQVQTLRQYVEKRINWVPGRDGEAQFLKKI